MTSNNQQACSRYQGDVSESIGLVTASGLDLSLIG